MGENKRLRSENMKLVEALQYYANDSHWVGVTEDSKFRTTFIAARGWDKKRWKVLDMNGWSVAENALREVSHGPSPTGKAMATRRSVDSATGAVDRHRLAMATGWQCPRCQDEDKRKPPVSGGSPRRS